MKFKILLTILSFASIVLTSCNDTVSMEEPDCLFVKEDCEIKPFCAWPPSPNTTSPLPVGFFYKGAPAPQGEFTYSWSSDSDFGGSAISIQYEDLPLTLIVTEIATGCEVELTLTIG